MEYDVCLIESMTDRCFCGFCDTYNCRYAWHSWELDKMDFTFFLSFSLFLFVCVCASLSLQSCACHSACMEDNSWESLFSLPVRPWNGTQVIRVCTNIHLHDKTQMSSTEKQGLCNNFFAIRVWNFSKKLYGSNCFTKERHSKTAPPPSHFCFWWWECQDRICGFSEANP